MNVRSTHMIPYIVSHRLLIDISLEMKSVPMGAREPIMGSIRVKLVEVFTDNVDLDLDTPITLNGSTQYHFEQMSDLSQLQNDISDTAMAVQFMYDRHPNKPSYLMDLTVNPEDRFDHLSDLSDLEDEDESSQLFDLANSILYECKHAVSLSHIDTAVYIFQEVLERRPESHPSQPMSLKNLAGALLTRFSLSNRYEDLDQAIVLLRESMSELHHSFTETAEQSRVYVRVFCFSSHIRTHHPIEQPLGGARDYVYGRMGRLRSGGNESNC
jgi:hypothetical protein